MDKMEKLALALLLSVAQFLLRDHPIAAGVRNAANDLQSALWHARDA